ncbi:putative zinc finger homeobox protein 3-like [Scophthalmus maximus]|uniref:Putative zinc finger homeobox protein 3-like n=1 Tax=Scophthalmus maximus TaxID=52904 RepID=A0A2U9BYM3_SCOMX|nr:putative zinc finger homeobox protein 3-like [Scophthalmus maximus]
MAPAKEPLTLLQQEEGAEGSQAREESQGGEQKEGGRHSRENGVRQKQGMKEDFGEGYLSGQRKEEGEVHYCKGQWHTRQQNRRLSKALPHFFTLSKALPFSCHLSKALHQSVLLFCPVVRDRGTEPASTLAEDDGPEGVSHSSISNGDGAKAPEPNDNQPDTEVDDERDKDGEQKEAVLKNLNQDLSSNSLTSHMTIMHSRNSCKTLKCPKCNWHYKSQHTLQVHMKEKHPETEGHCVCGASGGKCVCGGTTRGVCGYCHSGKPHPRLARGETYACGYKPYRCEVCDYATSSKGNLSIHMQSDKHLNNVQNGGHSNGHMHTPHVTNNSSSSNGHTVDEPAYKLPLSIPTPPTPPAKLTPPAHSHSHGKRWRCDVCDYETSIARNLRIHTTSEKHTHNMLRLQRGYYLSHCRSLAPQLKHLHNTGE